MRKGLALLITAALAAEAWLMPKVAEATPQRRENLYSRYNEKQIEGEQSQGMALPKYDSSRPINIYRDFGFPID